jgi:hypothetical protein
MLKDLRNLTEAEQQEYLDRFIQAKDEQNFPQEVVALYLDCSPGHLQECAVISQQCPSLKLVDVFHIKRKMSYNTKEVRLC